MARPLIEPVTDATLPEFAQFLHQHLQSSRSAEEWAQGLRTNWSAEQPNYGFVVRNEGQIVGGIGAYYADRVIGGKAERFCNITSWCVLDAFRQQSMRLAMSVVSQPGWHFTDFSPTKVVGATLKFFKFKELDEQVAVILNRPALSLGVQLISQSADIEASLNGEALRIYRDHSRFPWLQHVLLKKGPQICHVIYKRRSFKRLPSAEVLYLSDPQLFSEKFSALGGHLLLRGMVSTHVERRFLDDIPGLHKLRSGFNPKVYLSPSLIDAQIDYLYSETMALDL